MPLLLRLFGRSCTTHQLGDRSLVRLVDRGQFHFVAPPHNEVGVIKQHLTVGLQDWHRVWVSVGGLACKCIVVVYSCLITTHYWLH